MRGTQARTGRWRCASGENAWQAPAPSTHQELEIPSLRCPGIEGDLSTGLTALWGTGPGWLLSHGRLGCGGDRLQSRQVPAQGHAPWLGERDLAPRT